MLPLQQYFHSLGHFLIPEICPGCGHALRHNTNKLCWRCLAELPMTTFERHSENAVAALFYGRMRVEKAAAFLFFNAGSLSQQIIHQIKYKSNLELGKYMGILMAQPMLQQGWHQNIDAIIPLPLNRKKLLKRGYNQSLLLSEGLSDALRLPVETVAVMRTVFTQTQTRKSRLQRWANVEQVFDLSDAAALSNKHVLLVDDVITTGATIEACGQRLLQVPGLRLSVCSLAFASKI
jgi:ComF family protein